MSELMLADTIPISREIDATALGHEMPLPPALWGDLFEGLHHRVLVHPDVVVLPDDLAPHAELVTGHLRQAVNETRTRLDDHIGVLCLTALHQGNMPAMIGFYTPGWRTPAPRLAEVRRDALDITSRALATGQFLH